MVVETHGSAEPAIITLKGHDRSGKIQDKLLVYAIVKT